MNLCWAYDSYYCIYLLLTADDVCNTARASKVGAEIVFHGRNCRRTACRAMFVGSPSTTRTTTVVLPIVYVPIIVTPAVHNR